MKREPRPQLTVSGRQAVRTARGQFALTLPGSSEFPTP